jgi:DNA-binding transcriptional ArsR family regulator
VARAATTTDAFNAIAEPRRRDILEYLAPRERPVSDIVRTLGMEQPSVSKHLRVLRDVGLVHVRRDGRHVYIAPTRVRFARCTNGPPDSNATGSIS